MKKIISAFLITSLFISCSSINDDNLNNEVILNTLPTKAVFNNNNSETFTYKNTSELSEISNSTGTKIFTYDAGNIVKVSIFQNNKVVETLDYKYANNIVSTETITYENGDKIIYLYEWITENHLKYTKVDVQNPESETGECFYTNGNLTKTVNILKNNDVTSTYENIYEYDTKQNPFVNIKSFNKINLLDSNYGKNNIIKTTMTTTHTSNGGTTTNSITTNSSYVYNSKNFPDKQTTKGLNSNGESTTNIKDYFYKN